MKVVYLMSNICQYGGIERTICKTASFLAERYGYSISIYSFYSRKHSQPCFELSPKVEVVHCGADYKQDTRIGLIKRMYHIAKNTNADILITLNSDTNRAAFINKIFFKGKIIAEEHQACDNYTNKGLLINSLFFRFADKLVLLSAHNENYYISKGFKNTIVIPNAIESTTTSISDLKNKTIVAAGRLEWLKGFDLLIEAFYEFHKSMPDWKLLLLGDGEDYDKLKRQIENLGLEGCVEMPGFVRNVEEYFEKSSVFVLSSRSEGLPMVLLEAMKKGLACCAFDIPAAVSILDSKCGILVPQGDIKQLAARLAELAGSYEKRCYYAENAIKRVQDFYIDSVGEKWDDLFKELISR